jgi:GxxExxY protein
MATPRIRKPDLLYPELSYIIVGCAFDVFNALGPGHAEKVYQGAMALCLRGKGLAFSEQHYFPVDYEGEVLDKGFCDFLVEHKVIVEIKKHNFFSKSHIDRVVRYLKASNLQLALLINFGAHQVFHKRIPNLY